jgi:hypothetical protein
VSYVPFTTTNVAGGNIATITIAWANLNAVVGDVVLLGWSFQNTMTPTNPTGFTQDITSNSTTGSMTSRIFHKLVDGTESGNITFTISAIGRQAGLAVTYRGLYQTSPLGGTIQARQETVSGTTHANPTYTTTFPDEVVCTMIGERSTTGTNGWTPPASYTERADTTTLATGSGGTVLSWADDGIITNRAAATAVTPGVWTSTNAFATAGVTTYTLGLRPLLNSYPRPTLQAVKRASTY